MPLVVDHAGRDMIALTDRHLTLSASRAGHFGSSDAPCCVAYPGISCCLQCDVDTMCGVSLNMDMRDMLIGQPDYCTIVRECQVCAPLGIPLRFCGTPSWHAESLYIVSTAPYPPWVSLSLQAGVTPGTTDGKPSVTLSLTEVTPAVSSVLNNDGHPELKQFAAMRSAGPTQMDVALVPAARADGSHASTIAIRSGAVSAPYIVCSSTAHK